MSEELIKRITDYLASGGLFNPEMANHDAVRDLLIDCRAAISQQTEPVAHDLPRVIGNDGKPWPQTMDGLAWAKEFNRYFPSVPVDFALGWFCNAIMCGYDTYPQRNTAQQSGVREGDLARACNLAGLDYQVFLKIKAYLPVDAITRAADQVNTDTVSVPTVPTDAMRDAGNEIIKNRSQLFQAWNAMLRAAQEGKK